MKAPGAMRALRAMRAIRAMKVMKAMEARISSCSVTHHLIVSQKFTPAIFLFQSKNTTIHR